MQIIIEKLDKNNYRFTAYNNSQKIGYFADIINAENKETAAKIYQENWSGYKDIDNAEMLYKYYSAKLKNFKYKAL